MPNLVLNFGLYSDEFRSERHGDFPHRLFVPAKVANHQTERQCRQEAAGRGALRRRETKRCATSGNDEP